MCIRDRLSEAARELSGRLGTGDTKKIEGQIDEARETVRTCLEDAEGAFIALSEFHDGDERRPSDIRFREAVVESPEYSRLSSESRMLESRLEKLAFPVSYTHLRAHETRHDLVCRLLLEKNKDKL